MVLEREGYGMGFPSHGIMELVWSPYTTLEWGTLKVRQFKVDDLISTQNWVTEVMVMA